MNRGFTAEINSKQYVKNISISNEAHNRVLFEGTFGELEEVYMVEDKVLEIKGTHGTLRIDVTKEELERIFKSENVT
ncbi:MAG: hypothetical protein NWE89_16435 [Candidatus Bathyarchaeota archaeon]|nr:hypothetical protein [Candidatus Bathyarchaeota archaeon]